jgi:ribosomal protein S18 acetylase RimI-like enzyme
VTIERVSEVDDPLVDAVARLLTQLSPNRRPPSRAELEEVVAAPGTTLFVARGGEAYVGMLTLILYRIPIGLRGLIHDVVVDGSARGQGIGEQLTQAALAVAEEAGVAAVELTTRDEREAANRLYRRLGFELRKTNVYVWRPR